MNKQELDEVKGRIHQYLISKTNFLEVKDKLNDDQLRIFVDRAITELCQVAEIKLTLDDRSTLIRELVSAVISLGPIRALMEDETISEIMINGPSQIYIQRSGKLLKSDVTFPDNNSLMHMVQKILAASTSSRRVDESSPYVDFSMPDGSRVNILLPPCSLNGPVITIRKFDKEIDTVDDLIGYGTLNKEMGMFLTAAIRAHLNVVFCGATGSGKTTTLNVLSHHIPAEERIITIEDTAELRLIQEHVVSLQSKPSNIEGRGAITIRDLFVNSLRMRPDRIIVGEVRGNEILDMVQSISSGHAGSLSIVHAESPEECFSRMTTMMLMSGINLDVDEIQRQIAQSIDVIVYSELFIDGTRRIANITDVAYDKQTKDFALRDIFTFNQDRIDDNGKVHGDWVRNKQKPSSYKKFEKRNIKLPQGFFND